MAGYSHHLPFSLLKQHWRTSSYFDKQIISFQYWEAKPIEMLSAKLTDIEKKWNH